MFCPQCGGQLPGVGGFCPACGSPRPETGPVQQQAPATPQQTPPIQEAQPVQPPSGAATDGVPPPAPTQVGPGAHGPGTIAHADAGGSQAVTAVPDVCETPAPTAGPVPVPYPNVAQAGDAGSKHVKIEGKETASKQGSTVPMATGDEPGTSGPVQGPAGLAGLTDKLPGPLKGSNPFLVGALVLAVIAGVVVVTGDIGWTYDRDVFYPYHYPEEVPMYSYLEYSYDVSDGGMYAAGIAVIALLLFLTAIMALLAIVRARTTQARIFLMGGIGLAVGALIATIAGSVAFGSWAADEEFNDWGIGSSIWGGIIGSILLIILFAVPMKWAWPIKVGSPLRQPQPGTIPPPGQQGPPPPGPYLQPPSMGRPPQQMPPQQRPPQAKPPGSPPPGQPPPQYPPGQPPPPGYQQPPPYQQNPQQQIPPRKPPL